MDSSIVEKEVQDFLNSKVYNPKILFQIERWKQANNLLKDEKILKEIYLHLMSLNPPVEDILNKLKKVEKEVIARIYVNYIFDKQGYFLEKNENNLIGFDSEFLLNGILYPTAESTNIEALLNLNKYIFSNNTLKSGELITNLKRLSYWYSLIDKKEDKS